MFHYMTKTTLLIEYMPFNQAKDFVYEDDNKNIKNKI